MDQNFYFSCRDSFAFRTTVMLICVDTYWFGTLIYFFFLTLRIAKGTETNWSSIWNSDATLRAFRRIAWSLFFEQWSYIIFLCLKICFEVAETHWSIISWTTESNWLSIGIGTLHLQFAGYLESCFGYWSNFLYVFRKTVGRSRNAVITKLLKNGKALIALIVFFRVFKGF